MSATSKASLVDESRVRRRKVLRVVVFSLLLDLISFTFILPLFPRLLEFYRDQEAPAFSARPDASFVGDASDSEATTRTLLHVVFESLHRYKTAFSRPIEARYDIVLLGGALGSLFSLLQALASPVIGRIADRYGRRRALLLSMVGNTVSVFLWLVATNFPMFLASRVVAGLSEGNVQLATAIATDISGPADRQSTMALIGACFSIAFTFGPALGAWLSTLSVIAENPFAAPAGVSLLLIVVETVYLYFCLPETLAVSAKQIPEEETKEEKEKKRKEEDDSDGHHSAALHHAVHFFFLLFFSGMESSLAFVTYDLFSFSSRDNGRMLAYVGLVASLIQGTVTRRLAPKTAVRLGVASCLVAFVLLAQLQTQRALYVAATALALTSATVVTGLNSLTSLTGTQQDKAKRLGVLRSWGQLGRALGPLVFTTVYWWAGRETAYIFGATGMMTVTAMVFGL